jgi:hypothetical protein
MRALVLVSLWTSLGFLPHQTPPPRDLPRGQTAPSGVTTGAISGRVYALGTGAPLRGLNVSLVPATPDAPGVIPDSRTLALGGAARGSTVVTDAFGRFHLTDVLPGRYRVVVTPGSYRGRYLPMGFGALRPNDAGRPVTVGKGEEIRNLDIGLLVGVAIEGRILDDAGEPLSRISVFAMRLHATGDPAQRVPHAPAVTDDLGRYRLYGLEPGTYLVGADGQFVVPQWQQSDGRIHAVSLAPRETEPFVTTFHPSALTDAAAQPVRVGSQDATGVDIVLQRARRFRVSGILADSQGTPAASSVLVLLRAGLGLMSDFTVRTDAEGRFQLPPLEAGTYRLLVGRGLWPGLASVNGRTEFADVTVNVAADADDLAIFTQPGIGIAGRIVFAEGEPASPLPVQLAFRRPPIGSAVRDLQIAATLGDDWRFFGSDVFGPLLVRATLPSGWVVKAVTLGGADITDVPTVFGRHHDGQLQVVLSSRPSTLDGTIRAEPAAAPPDATVYVFSEDRASWTMSSPRTATSDVRGNGTFSVGGLAGGRYYAIAIDRTAFRKPVHAGPAFFERLSQDATLFTIGDDDRRTLDLPLWHWPE